ncbi:uncharacterized protein [Mobula birostris]|uniref:uncharacterized protein isoform X2 n=1 Tax=Mobula birostris TaxID=1983395 RepID=UPI003B28094F
MTTFNITIFLFFSFFLKGTITSETTTTVTQTDLTSLGITSNGSTTSNSNASVSTGETRVTTKAAINASTDDNSTSFSVTSNGQSTYSTAASSTKDINGQMSMPTPTPATIGTNSLSVIAFAVIILIIILVIVVVILASVIILRFKCCGCQETPQDTSKARSEGPSESSHANGEKESITLVSMRSLYTEAGGQESSAQGYLQNESNEIDEMINNFSK